MLFGLVVERGGIEKSDLDNDFEISGPVIPKVVCTHSQEPQGSDCPSGAFPNAV